MGEYIFMVFMPLVLYFIMSVRTGKLQFKRERQLPWIIIVFFSVLLLLLALRRETVGTDLGRYIYLFRISRVLPLESFVKQNSTELLFHLMTRFLRMIGGVRSYIVILSVITLVPIAVLYYTESEKPMLTIAFFIVLPVFGMLFSGLRQAVAIGIAAVSFYFVKNKRLVPFILLIVLASLFHVSALFAMLLYPAYRIRFKRWMLAVVVPLLLLTFFYNDRIFPVVVQWFGSIYEGEAVIERTGATGMLVLFALVLAFSFFVPEESRMDDETAGLRNIAILTVFIQCFAMVNTVVMRMNYYFILFLPILVGRIINRTGDRYLIPVNIIGWGMTGYFIFYFFHKMATGSDSFGFYPYAFFFTA